MSMKMIADVNEEEMKRMQNHTLLYLKEFRKKMQENDNAMAMGTRRIFSMRGKHTLTQWSQLIF